MPWLQLRIDTCRQQAQHIEDALLFAGALSVTLQDNADQPILEPALGETPLWAQTRLTALFDAEVDTTLVETKAAAFLSELLPQPRWDPLEDKNWERAWMDHYQPLQCAENLWICPSWCQPPVATAVNLLLDPGLAFGTGTHPTTFLCLKWLAHETLADKKVLDFGCGSGILGIAALLLGARHAVGTDIDPQALLASRDNALRNGLNHEQFPVCLPDQLTKTAVDLILANILAGPLIELAPQLITHVKINGRLCLSGVLAVQAQQVRAAYSQWVDFDADAQHAEWVRLTGTRRR